MTKISNQEKAAKSAKKVWDFVKNVPSEEVPLNQFKQANKKKVLELARVPISAKDNKEVQKAIDYLNNRIGTESNSEKKIAIQKTDEMKVLERRLTHFQNQVVSLQAELDKYRRAKIAENWFLKTGRLLRP